MITVAHACTAKMYAWGFLFIYFFYFILFIILFFFGGGGGVGSERIRFRESKDDFEMSGLSKYKIKT